MKRRARQSPAATAVARAIVAVLATVQAVGCVNTLHAPSILPARHALVTGQLVVHSENPLPANHRLLKELTDQRDQLSQLLTLPRSDEPIHVYLFDTPQEFSRFLALEFPEFPERRAFFIETDTQLAVYAQWGDRVAEDLRHEVAHGYLHAVVPNIPLWLDEGLAEYFEVARGAGGLNRPHVAELSAALAAGQWRPFLARLESITAVADMTQRYYAESWAWVHLMLHGPPQLRQVLCDYLQSLRSSNDPVPFAPRLAAVLPQPEPVLVEHLRLLAGNGTAAP
ncbi:MAG: DUF1570 domain-containing protein [Pirellulales bacterium]|nr:DUF1570 domain-containing protein [Pirellulales bacterium]